MSPQSRRGGVASAGQERQLGGGTFTRAGAGAGVALSLLLLLQSLGFRVSRDCRAECSPPTSAHSESERERQIRKTKKREEERQERSISSSSFCFGILLGLMRISRQKVPDPISREREREAKGHHMGSNEAS